MYDAVETGETVTLAVVALVDHKYVAVPPAGLIVMLGVRVTGVPEETVFALLAMEIIGRGETLNVIGVPSSVTPELMTSLLYCLLTVVALIGVKVELVAPDNIVQAPELFL